MGSSICLSNKILLKRRRRRRRRRRRKKRRRRGKERKLRKGKSPNPETRV
jgi:hypothetical protein